MFSASERTAIRDHVIDIARADELRRALALATNAFLREVAHSDPVLADRLAGPLRPETLC